MSELHIRQSNLERAMDFCNKSALLLQSLDDMWAFAENQKLYGMIYMRQHNPDLADKSFKESIRASLECGYLPNIAEVNFELGLMYKQKGMAKESLVYFEESKRIFKELDIPSNMESVDKYIGEVRTLIF